MHYIYLIFEVTMIVHISIRRWGLLLHNSTIVCLHLPANESDITIYFVCALPNQILSLLRDHKYIRYL